MLDVPPAGGSRRPSLRTIVAAAVSVLLVLSAVALSLGMRSGAESSSMDASSDSDSAGVAAAGMAEPEGLQGGLADGAVLDKGIDGAEAGTAGTGSSGSTAAALLDDRSVIRTADLSLTSDDVSEARQALLSIVDGVGGYVADEQSRADRGGSLRSAALTLQVPTDDLDVALERFARIGTVVARSQSAQDVTEQVVDVDSRVDSAQAALRRVRLLLSRASSLGDVIRLEQVLSSRQADLESLLSQQESLAASTSLATVRVSLTRPSEVSPKPVDEADGFLAGLARGWDALGAGYVALATLAGTLLPTVAVLALLALGVRLALRLFAGRSRWGRRPAAGGTA